MKKILAVVVLIMLAIAHIYFGPPKTAREKYRSFIHSHPYTEMLAEGNAGEEEEAGEEKSDRPDLAFMQDFLRTMDPLKKRPTPELLHDQNIRTAIVRDRKLSRQARKQASTSLAEATIWEERGPANVGGRTRALLFDPADASAKKVWAGGVSGGLWFNDDITDLTSPWHKVSDFWDNLSISCLTNDPNNNQIMYAGTGESHVDIRGGGIWKTSDGGDTWTRLSSTTTFLGIRDIRVRNENGTSVVYAAVHPAINDVADNPVYTGGLYRSANGGTSWTQVLPLLDGTYTNLPTDIEIAADNQIYVGTKAHFWVADAQSTIYKSSTGLAGSWIADNTFTNSNLQFTGQIELATAPSDANRLYAIIEDNDVVAGIFKSVDKAGNWTSLPEPVDSDLGIPSDDFTRGQAWYDLTIAVNPTNANEVIVGGIDLFKSTNAGAAWTQLSKWHNGLSGTLPVVHADQHEILYRPGTSEAIFGNDGGVYYGNNLTAGTSSASISAHNKNYNVTQFYTGALHPVLPNYMLGGTQDNGTQKFTSAGFGITSEAQGGDGAMCFIDQLDPNFQIVSYVYNDVSLSKDGGITFDQLLNDASTGNFINVGEYDSNKKILYTAKNENGVYRVKKVTTTPEISTLSIPGLGSIATALRVSPHTTTQSNLYVGTIDGQVFKILNAEGGSPTISEITGSAFPTGSVSCISFGASEKHILVTFFNYGVINLWETRDGGTTWKNREGNFPNMPVRWAEFHPHNTDQVYIATELGVWSTDNISVASPEWSPTNGGLANVRTDMLRVRKSDGVMMASTYGRGVFTAIIPSQLEQVITFDALPVKTFGDAPFSIFGSSTSLLDVEFTSSDPDIASISGNTITIKGAGTVTITATQQGNIYYKAADAVTQTLTINKATQTITFSALADKAINDDSFDLTATASSALNVTFISSNTSIASVSGNTVTITGVGTTTITAKQPGNANYLAASDVSRDLKIVSRIINVSGDLDFGEVVIGETASSDVTITNTGTAPITISGLTYPEGYTGDTISTSPSIVIKVTFTPLEPKEYNGDMVVESNATSGTNTLSITGTGISITEAEKIKDDGLTVYPNPASDWVVIAGGDFSHLKTVSLTHENGTSFTEPVESTITEMRLKIAALPAGTYIIAIPADEKVYFRKFTKK
jgi:photosystem II stability/assembly factor-like uncharacterized protein